MSLNDFKNGVVGIGFLSPVHVGGIPGIGPVLDNICVNVKRADAGLGRIGHRVGQLVGRFRVPGNLSVGVGCGVAVGYGWGAGVMLSPWAAKRIVQTMQSHMPARLASILSRESLSGAAQLNAAAGGGGSGSIELNAAAAATPQTEGRASLQGVNKDGGGEEVTAIVNQLERRCRLLEMEVADLKKRVASSELPAISSRDEPSK